MSIYILVALIIITIVLYVSALVKMRKAMHYNEELFKTCVDLQEENKELKQRIPSAKKATMN